MTDDSQKNTTLIINWNIKRITKSYRKVIQIHFTRRTHDYVKLLKYIDKFKNMEQFRNKYLQVRPHFGLWFDPCLTASDPTKVSAGVLYIPSFKFNVVWFFVPIKYSLMNIGVEARRKDIRMTFDPDKYVEQLDGLDLPHDQKIELVHSLHAWAQGFIDRAFGRLPSHHCNATLKLDDSNNMSKAVKSKMKTKRRRL